MNIHVLEITVAPKTADAATLLPAALAQLAAKDPALGFRHDAESGSLVLAADSEAHLEAAIDRLTRDFNLDLAIGQPQVAFRETITRAIEYDYTHRKLIGSAGQFARLKLRFEPQPRGSGFTVANALAVGVLPDPLVQGIETGLTQASQTGVRAGYPVIEVKAMLIDAAYHDTDSSPKTFAVAARACFREATVKAGPLLLEPIMRIEVTTPAEYMSKVIADLNGRRARVSGMEPRQHRWIVSAEVPFAAMLGYIDWLYAATRGVASYVMSFDHYAPVGAGGDLDPVHPGAAIGLRIA